MAITPKQFYKDTADTANKAFEKVYGKEWPTHPDNRETRHVKPHDGRRKNVKGFNKTLGEV